MIRLWDGFLSVIAALLTAAILGVPLWGAFRAVRAELIPLWSWGPMVLLGLAGAIMVASFGRKAIRGVHPMRDRRR